MSEEQQKIDKLVDQAFCQPESFMGSDDVYKFRAEVRRQCHQLPKLIKALTDLRHNVDVSTINNSKRSTARWTELVIQAEEALKT